MKKYEKVVHVHTALRDRESAVCAHLGHFQSCNGLGRRRIRIRIREGEEEEEREERKEEKREEERKEEKRERKLAVSGNVLRTPG